MNFLKSYYDNGQLKSIVPLIDGIKHGTERKYFPTGKIWIERQYVNGIKHGIEKTYWFSGKDKQSIIRHEMFWFHGQAHGIEKWYDEQGNIIIIQYYWYDKAISKEQWENIPRLTKLLSGVTETLRF